MRKATAHARLPALERLLGAVAVASAEPDPRRRALAALAGVAETLGARVTVVVRVHVDSKSGVATFDETLMAGNLTPAERGAQMAYIASVYRLDPFFDQVRRHLAQVKPSGASFGFARQQLVADRDWYPTEHYTQVRRGIGLDASIYAGVRDERPGVERGWWLGGGIHRALSKPQFKAEEAKLVERFMVGVRPLLETFASRAEPTSSPLLSNLAPRQQELVLELLTGRSGKQIAARLGITEQSVQTYCKRLYRQLGVSGRAELAALCQRHGVREALVAEDGAERSRPAGVAAAKRGK